MSNVYTSITDQRLYKKEGVKPLINRSLHYIFPKQNWPATPLPQFITQMYLLLLKMFDYLFEFTDNIYLERPTPRKFTRKINKFSRGLLKMLVTFKMSSLEHPPPLLFHLPLNYPICIF